MKPTAYQYAVIRYMHDLVTGECLNVAIVAFSQRDRAFVFKASPSSVRIQYAFPSAKVSALRQSLSALEAGLRAFLAKNHNAPLSAALSDVLVGDDLSLGASPVGAGFAQTVEAGASDLLQRFVLHWETSFDASEEIFNRVRRWDRDFHLAHAVKTSSSNDSQWQDVDEFEAMEARCYGT